MKRLWDVYTNTHRIGLTKFWQEAFEAAYEELSSDVPEVLEAAISEIAKMSVRSIDIESPSLQSSVSSLLSNGFIPCNQCESVPVGCLT